MGLGIVSSARQVALAVCSAFLTALHKAALSENAQNRLLMLAFFAPVCPIFR
jgi:hypothetical protein